MCSNTYIRSWCEKKEKKGDGENRILLDTTTSLGTITYFLSLNHNIYNYISQKRQAGVWGTTTTTHTTFPIRGFRFRTYIYSFIIFFFSFIYILINYISPPGEADHGYNKGTQKNKKKNSQLRDRFSYFEVRGSPGL